MAMQSTARGVPYPDDAEANDPPLHLQLLADWINDNTVGSEDLPAVPSWGQIDDVPDVFPPAPHNHDGLYYRKVEVDDFLTALANAIALKAPKANPTLTGTITLGGSDTDVEKHRAVEVETHARARSFTWTAGRLTRITETAGATTVRVIDLTYTEDQVSTVVVTAGGVTATTTMTYDDAGILTGTTRAVA